ncbi:Hypothetical protein PHPALM_13793 [Phytophthora palmivora]|uniref:Uncharacterized protein n=1 Tax=Phytophthora palmivora TaxID=4796 RepID=A0A2P4XWG4_9STRA|nr:Hypothetical protein PHPALM_13793 [Phytophthora palmivora]
MSANARCGGLVPDLMCTLLEIETNLKFVPDIIAAGVHEVADTIAAQAAGVGTMKITSLIEVTEVEVYLDGILYVPGAAHGLLSKGLAKEQGFDVNYDRATRIHSIFKEEKLVLRAHPSQGIWDLSNVTFEMYDVPNDVNSKHVMLINFESSNRMYTDLLFPGKGNDTRYKAVLVIMEGWGRFLMLRQLSTSQCKHFVVRAERQAPRGIKKITQRDMDTQGKEKSTSSTQLSFFVPLTAPMVESTSHAALVEWKKRRKEYEQEVAVCCCHDPGKIMTMMTNIRNSFEPSLLDVLCDLEWGIGKEDLNDELLLSKIDAIINTVKNNTVPNVAAEFKLAVRMNLQESDVRERVIQFFKSSRQVIEEQGWADFFKDQEGMKLKCKLLVASLEPQTLREDVEAILAYQNRAARTEEKVLFKIILEKALEHERDFQRRKRQRNTTRNGVQRERIVENDRPRKQFRAKTTYTTKAEQSFSSKRETNSTQQILKGKSRSVVDTPEGGCLKCKGDHWLVRCPVATHEEKTNLLRQQHERRNREKNDRKKVTHE